MRPLFLLLTGLLCLLLTGCPPDLEVPPAFVTVTDFDLTTSPGQGAATSDIREVWVFVDNIFQGAYGLPARIPLEFSGATEVVFRAGIRQNGITATPDFYDFYAPVDRTLELVPGETIELGVLPLRYRSDARFALIEDFEPGNNRTFDQPVFGSRAIVPQTEVVRSGLASGRLTLDNPDNSLVEISSANALTELVADRPYVYLEIDYRGDVFGQWGVTGARGSELIRNFDPGFNPREEWTKIYFELAPIIVETDLSELLLLLSAVLPADSDTGELYIDNIKVLYF